MIHAWGKSDSPVENHIMIVLNSTWPGFFGSIIKGKNGSQTSMVRPHPSQVRLFGLNSNFPDSMNPASHVAPD